MLLLLLLLMLIRYAADAIMRIADYVYCYAADAAAFRAAFHYAHFYAADYFRCLMLPFHAIIGCFSPRYADAAP